MNDIVRDPMEKQSAPGTNESGAAPPPADAGETSPAPTAGDVSATAAPTGTPAGAAPSPSPESEQRRDAVSLLIDILVAPVGAFRYLSEQLHVWLALVVAVASSLTTSAAPAVLPFVDEGLGTEEAPSLIGSFVTFILVTALLHVVARLLGGRNGFVYILQAMAFSSLPSVLAAPFYVLQRVVDVPGLILLVNIGTNVWAIVLGVVALRAVYGFSTARAVATFLIAFVLLVVLSIPFAFGALLLGA